MGSKKPTRPQPHAVLTAEVARQWRKYELKAPPWLPDPMTSYTDIVSEAARILGKDRSERDLNLDGLTSLSAETAKSLSRYRGPLSLYGLRSIDPEVEELLFERTRKGTYLQVTFLEGLEVLESPRLAKVLAAAGAYRGELYFNRMRRLSPEAAAILADAKCTLGFGGHTQLSPEVNKSLRRCGDSLRFYGRKRVTLKDVHGLGADGETHEGNLIFGHARQLDADAAAVLAHYPGSAICFSALESMSPEAAEAIAKFHGTLELRSLVKVSPRAAVTLANRTADTLLQGHSIEAGDGGLIVRLAPDRVFNLGEVRKLTPELAATLSAAPILDFRNLKTLTPQAARVLAEQHHGSLLLDGLESLPDKVAAALSWHDGGVSLRAVQRISLSAARYLTEVRGFLSLGGLKTLTPQLATVLAGFSGNLMLDGVTELTPGVARKLQKHTGILSMNGVSEISEETAKILAGKPNQKRMVRCGGSIAAVQYLLKNDPDRVTMMFRLNSDGAFE